MQRLSASHSPSARRDSAPHYGLLILNRNGKQNYIQAISSATEVEVQDRMINLDEGAGGDQSEHGLRGASEETR